MLGQDPSQFWTLTLKEIDIIVRGAVARHQRQHDELAWAVWHVARLTVYHPEKPSDFVGLEEMLSRPSRQKKELDWERTFELTKSWVEEVRKNG